MSEERIGGDGGEVTTSITPKYRVGQHIRWQIPTGESGDGIIRAVTIFKHSHAIFYNLIYGWVDEQFVTGVVQTTAAFCLHTPR